MATDLAGKISLITGAGSGIGRETALTFARSGAQLIISDIDQNKGEETLDLINKAGGKVEFVAANVTIKTEVNQLIAHVQKSYGKLDCAVNNAGVEGMYGLFHEWSDEALEQVLEVNVKGVWWCMQAQLQLMLQQGGGSIVNVASVAGLVGSPLMSGYAASKHAVIGLTKTVAAEYGRYNIRVNAVCPGIIQTSMFERAVKDNPKLHKLMIKGNPCKRVGKPEEVAESIAWLSSDSAPFITGTTLAIDGGLTAI